jgi:hypothetical protein
MTPEEQAAAEQVRATFDRVVAEGLKAESVAGASDEQVDAWAAAQGVTTVPAAVREALRIVGVTRGLWLAGSAMGVEAVTERSKRQALATLADLPDPLRDAAGMLVLVEHQAYSYHVVDGADLDQPDPPVWVINEGEDVQQYWPSVTYWFDGTAPSVKQYRSRLRLMRKQGSKLVPSWGDYIRLDD